MWVVKLCDATLPSFLKKVHANEQTRSRKPKAFASPSDIAAGTATVKASDADAAKWAETYKVHPFMIAAMQYISKLKNNLQFGHEEHNNSMMMEALVFTFNKMGTDFDRRETSGADFVKKMKMMLELFKSNIFVEGEQHAEARAARALLATDDVVLRMAELPDVVLGQYVPIPFGAGTSLMSVVQKIRYNRGRGTCNINQNMPDEATMLHLTRGILWKNMMQTGLNYVHSSSMRYESLLNLANARQVIAWGREASSLLGHALRMSNSKNPDNGVVIQNVPRLLIDNGRKVGVEKAAMVNNFAALIAATATAATYKMYFDGVRTKGTISSIEDLPRYVRSYFLEPKELLKEMDRIWDCAGNVFRSGYAVKGAENGTPMFVKARMATVSNFADYVMTMRASGGGEGGNDGELHRFENWDVPLLMFKDGPLELTSDYPDWAYPGFPARGLNLSHKENQFLGLK